MTLLVLIILAVIWAAVLLPPYLQNRSENRPADSISTFQRQLSVLERRSAGAPAGTARPPLRPVVPGYAATHAARIQAARMSRAEARRRRRDVLFTLVGAAGLTLLLAVLLGGSVWLLHLAVDAALGGFVYLLYQQNQRALERQHKVRYLPARPARHLEPALLQRSGS